MKTFWKYFSQDDVEVFSCKELAMEAREEDGDPDATILPFLGSETECRGVYDHENSLTYRLIE